jgi:hypothetical protein
MLSEVAHFIHRPIEILAALQYASPIFGGSGPQLRAGCSSGGRAAA